MVCYLKMTGEELEALKEALDYAGYYEENPLYSKILDAISCLDAYEKEKEQEGMVKA